MEDVKSNYFYNRYDNQAAAKELKNFACSLPHPGNSAETICQKNGLVPRFSLTFSFFRASEYMEEVVSDSP